MIWLALAFLSALSDSFANLFSKRALSDAGPYEVMLGFYMYALPFLLIALWIAGIPDISQGYLIALLASGVGNVVAITLYVKALQHADLSLVAPMLAFTPLFLLFTSPLIMRESIGLLGTAGVLAIVAGAYILNAHRKDKSMIAPLKALVRKRGPRYMLLVAFIFSITSNFDKMGVQASSPFFWTATLSLFVFTTLAVWKRSTPARVVKHTRQLLPIGFFVALTAMAQMVAIELIYVAFVISIKRLSTLLSTLWGWLFLHEGHPAERLLGAGIMAAGAIMITLA